jgi:phenylalanine-4-hydroxylase
MNNMRTDIVTMKLNIMHVGVTGDEDLIWHTLMQREEYNLNQRARQLDVHEAHVRRRERICDHREVEICLARMSGTNTGRENGPEQK